MDDDLRSLDLRPTALFLGTSVVAALVIGAMLISGWRAGSLDNEVEWLFWAGAILAAVGIACFGVASMPVRTASPSGLVRAGLVLFMVAPVLCVVAVFADYWI